MLLLLPLFLLLRSHLLRDSRHRGCRWGRRCVDFVVGFVFFLDRVQKFITAQEDAGSKERASGGKVWVGRAVRVACVTGIADFVSDSLRGAGGGRLLGQCQSHLRRSRGSAAAGQHTLDGGLAGEAGVMSLNRRKSIAPELLLAGTVNDDDKEKENLRSHNGTGTPTASAGTTFTPFKKMLDRCLRLIRGRPCCRAPRLRGNWCH